MSVPADRMFLQPQKSSVSLALPSPMMNPSKIATDPSAGLANMSIGTQPQDFNLGGTMMGEGTGLGGDTGFDWGGTMKGFSDFGSGVASLAGLYSAYKQLGMMEDQFNFARADRNQNVANQAAITNDRLRAQANAEAQLSGHKVGSAGYDEMMANRAKVSGAAI
jgi:hypothetical protein